MLNDGSHELLALMTECLRSCQFLRGNWFAKSSKMLHHNVRPSQPITHHARLIPLLIVDGLEERLEVSYIDEE
jgi:hypothetical protein